MRISKAALLFLVVCLVVGMGVSSLRAALVFDDLSNGESLTATGSTPNTFMGDGFTLAPATTDITGFDVFPYNNSGTSFTGLQLNIFVWGGVNTGAVSAATPAFSDLLASYSLVSSGTFSTGFYYSFQSATPGVTPGISLATPLLLPSTTVGITLAFAGTTDGTTYNFVNNLTSLLTYNTASNPGSEVFNGYYRNAAGEADGNFTSTLRSLGVNDQSIALRVYGDVPEPSSIAILAGAGIPLLMRRRRTA